MTNAYHNRIVLLDETTSTNAVAKELALQGADHGTVVMAKRQTGGKGRMGRRFESAEGGLYLSYILRPHCHARQLMHLTCAAAVAACQAVENVCSLRPGIKWTNDLVVGNKKIAGILTELQLDSDGSAAFAILGIGINCRQKGEDFPEELRSIAASLSMLTGEDIQPWDMAKELIRALDDTELSRKEEIMVSYRRRCITVGREISLVRGEEVLHAKAVDIDPDGALIIQLPDGAKQTVTSGEVSIRGMYGYV